MRWPLLTIACLVTCPSLIHAQQAQDSGDMPTDKIYAKVLPSVVTIEADMGNGYSIGTGFFALKDGLVVTAYHVIDGAKSAKVKFSDGEVFDVSGVVDADNVRDIALLRVKVYGKQMLSVNAQDPAVGSKVCAVGAPKGLEFSVSDGIISQIQTMSGIKQVQFTCPVSPGNSGGPLLNGKGEVVGVVDWQVTDGQNLNFAVPMSYVLGLDASLRTKEWDAIKWPPHQNRFASDEGSPDPAPSTTSLADFDQELVKATLLQRDCIAREMEIDAVGYDAAYHRGVPQSSYETETRILDEVGALEARSVSDDTRMGARFELIQRLKYLYYMIDVQVIALRQAISDGEWTSSTKDMSEQARARMAALPVIDHVNRLMKDEKFQELFPVAYLEMENIGSHHLPFNMGVASFVSDPLYFVAVEKKSIADSMRFRKLDRLETVDGQTPKDFHDLEDILIAKAGQKVKFKVVTFGGKERSWETTVPANLKG